jgi:hypothetical protein
MVTTQLSARDLFRAAYENRYTWDKSFPGYQADVTYKAGDSGISGRVCIDAKMRPQVMDLANEEATKAVLEQLQEIAIHRIRRDFEDTHGRNTFTYGETDETGAVEILMGGKAEGDHYKLRNNEVCKVHRHIHGIVVTIHTSSSHNTGKGYLSHRYDSVYHDPKTGEQRGGRIQFEDEYAQVGDYFVLSRRAIATETDDGPQHQELIFSNFELLSGD